MDVYVKYFKTLYLQQNHNTQVFKLMESSLLKRVISGLALALDALIL